MNIKELENRVKQDFGALELIDSLQFIAKIVSLEVDYEIDLEIEQLPYERITDSNYVCEYIIQRILSK